LAVTCNDKEKIRKKWNFRNDASSCGLECYAKWSKQEEGIGMPAAKGSMR
jgi:hypothetical protein